MSESVNESTSSLNLSIFSIKPESLSPTFVISSSSLLLSSVIVLPKVNDKGIISYLSYNGV